MSALGDAFAAIKKVVLIQADLEQMKRNIDGLSADVRSLGRGLATVNDRVSRLEGFIEGATAARRDRPALPQD